MNRKQIAINSIITAVFVAGWLGGCTAANIEDRPALETVARASSDPVVARVNGTQIFASDVTLAAQEQGLIPEGEKLPKSHAQYRRILDELIDQRLLALDAESRGLNGDRESKIRLAAARERILGNIRVERHLREAVNEEAIQRMYDEQSKLAARGDEVRARHILVEEKSVADEILKKLKAGADFATLAKTSSIDEGSAAKGGELGYFTQDTLDAEFTRPVFNAGKGERIGPIKSAFGWHIAEILDRRPAAQPSFESLRPEIINFMTFKAIQDLLLELQDNAEIVVVEDENTALKTEDTETPQNENETEE
jgi:peptidyl-prolyl cis-trans isomerase C